MLIKKKFFDSSSSYKLALTGTGNEWYTWNGEVPVETDLSRDYISTKAEADNYVNHIFGTIVQVVSFIENYRSIINYRAI